MKRDEDVKLLLKIYKQFYNGSDGDIGDDQAIQLTIAWAILQRKKKK